MWSGCLNARDIGGLPTRYGVPTRSGTVFRTDSPDNLDDDGRAAFVAAGAGLVLDLRSDWEIRQPHLLDGSAPYQRIPWIDPAAEVQREPGAEPLLADIYRGSLDRNKAQIAKAFRALIAAPADAPVVVHCKAGKEWIAAARELGLTVAIASSSPRPWVRGHLERVGAIEQFDEIVTGDEVDAHKPDPAIYELVLRRVGVPGAEAIAVEDTAHGVAAAQAAGMFAVAIPNPFVTEDAVAAADLVLGSADQLSLSELLLSASTGVSTRG